MARGCEAQAELEKLSFFWAEAEKAESREVGRWAVAVPRIPPGTDSSLLQSSPFIFIFTFVFSSTCIYAAAFASPVFRPLVIAPPNLRQSCPFGLLSPEEGSFILEHSPSLSLDLLPFPLTPTSHRYGLSPPSNRDWR